MPAARESTSRTSSSCPSARRASPRRSSGPGACAPRPRSSRRSAASPPRWSPTRAGWASRLPSNRAGLELLAAGIERAGLVPGRAGRDRRRRRRHPALRRRRLPARDRGPDARRGSASSTSSRRGAATSRSSRSRIRSPRTTGRAGRRRRAGSASASSCSATTCSSRTVERLERGIAEGVANAVLVKPNQCGTLTDAARRRPPRTEAGYATVVSARSRRHRGRLARRPRRRLARRPDQGGLDDALASARRSGTACCASRLRQAPRPGSRGRSALAPREVPSLRTDKGSDPGV